METQIMMIYQEGKTFAGKISIDIAGKETLQDCVEFIQGVNGQTGQMMVIGVLIGTLFNVSSNVSKFILDKKSPYYKNYFQAISGLQL